MQRKILFILIQFISFPLLADHFQIAAGMMFHFVKPSILKAARTDASYSENFLGSEGSLSRLTYAGQAGPFFLFDSKWNGLSGSSFPLQFTYIKEFKSSSIEVRYLDYTSKVNCQNNFFALDKSYSGVNSYASGTSVCRDFTTKTREYEFTYVLPFYKKILYFAPSVGRQNKTENLTFNRTLYGLGTVTSSTGSLIYSKSDNFKSSLSGDYLGLQVRYHPFQKFKIQFGYDHFIRESGSLSRKELEVRTVTFQSGIDRVENLFTEYNIANSKIKPESHRIRLIFKNEINNRFHILFGIHHEQSRISYSNYFNEFSYGARNFTSTYLGAASYGLFPDNNRIAIAGSHDSLSDYLSFKKTYTFNETSYFVMMQYDFELFRQKSLQ